MSIAAIIPLYNGAPFIRDALESVFRQTVPADEIIVVNDGSTDDGPALVRAMAGRYPVRIIDQPNGGQSSARNLGAAQTSCRYIALLDQDDIWHDDHLEILSAPLKEGGIRKVAMAYGDLDRIDVAGRIVQRNFLRYIAAIHPKTSRSDCVRTDMFILPSASMIDREVFLAVGGFDERLSGYEDDDLFHRIFSAGYEMAYVPRAVTRWRIYPSSTSFTSRMGRSRMTYFQKLRDTYPDEPELGLYWIRDLIAPRFFSSVCEEFARVSRFGSPAAMERTWEDLQIIIPFMRKSRRRKARAIAPLINAIGPARAPALTRKLLKWANRSGGRRVPPSS